jgi:hypothetical protein
MAAGERLPEDHPDGPDVASLAGLAPVESLRCDVCERPRDVPDRGERVRLVELGETEVEHARREAVAVLDQHVRGLHVAVDDPVAVRVREALEDLRRELDGGRVVELARADQLAQRAAADVLVRDVHMAVVRAEVVGAHAALVAQARRGLHLAGGPCRALALARDDLQCDVEPGLLVAGEPDRAGAAPTERPERPVAVEDERAIGKGEGSGGHRSQSLRRGRGSSSAAESAVHSSASGRPAEGPRRAGGS